MRERTREKRKKNFFNYKCEKRVTDLFPTSSNDTQRKCIVKHCDILYFKIKWILKNSSGLIITADSLVITVERYVIASSLSITGDTHEISQNISLYVQIRILIESLT